MFDYVHAHGYIAKPEPSWKGKKTSDWVVEIEPQWKGGWDESKGDEGLLATFKELSASNNYKDVRSMMDGNSVYGEDCGFTDPNGTPVDPPTDGAATFSRGIVHAGPCEIWLDDKMVLQNDDCQSAYGDGTQDTISVFKPVDYSSCASGGCMLRFYWLGLQRLDGKTVWQAYKNCIPLTGPAGGGGSPSTGDSDSPSSGNSDARATFARVCASNGVTYRNQCSFDKANCDNKGVRVLHTGICRRDKELMKRPKAGPNDRPTPSLTDMASPDKLLQLHSLYRSPSKLVAIASPPRKRKPTNRKPGTTGLCPLNTGNDSFSREQWTKWLHEAHELHVSSSMFLATTSSATLAQSATEGLQLVLNPVVARLEEKFAEVIDERATDLTISTTTVFTVKNSPGVNNTQQWRPRITKPMKQKKTRTLHIEPLLSNEMRKKLHAHLKEKIKGNLWENEIRSKLARPLSASTFCSRSEQLRHPLSSVQFTTETGSAAPNVVPKFPYSNEAHASANCIRRCVTKAWFRTALKARVRVVAIAIRVLRRRGIPLLVRGFRRRRRAAIRIQRCYRRFVRWRTEFLRPFVCRNVAAWVRQGLSLVAARVLLARVVTALYLARRARHWVELQRAKHLNRWVAKTRVSLFVHQTWTVGWFRAKRSANVDGMNQELALLETSDRNVRLKFTTVLATPLGKEMLKKELTIWRVHIGARTSTQEKTGIVEENLDPAILRLRQCFQVFDLDGSGTLDLDEFQLMLSYLRGKKSKKAAPKLSTAQVRTLFAELDCDGNGGITCNEFERWWATEHTRATLSTSASTNFLSRGLDGLLLQSHGLLFWLLGRKQQLERKFVKKLMVRRAMEKAKREILYQEIDCERAAGLASGVFRCGCCGRRFGLRRDLDDHIAHECSSGELVVDTFTLKRWIHEEEFRLLEDIKGGD
ncbi:hypothetical protein P3T76_010640 [Phytophthora citrophthora]|uniref:Calmodulin n=1 Tax=Phytophthora citrophthora TaxID=4793 RepID=A0AAD9GBQ7_9STRA|nr:hypothetical protein P3T76_010640 [Phytophthora citrophthora]